MPLSSRDIEEIEKAPLKEPRLTGFLLFIFRILMKFPPTRKRMAESVGGLNGRIFRCWKRKEYEEATRIAIHALEKFRNKKSKILPFMNHHHWWQFMQHGVDSANHIANEELRAKLMDCAKDGIEPFSGYDVAYSFLAFSRWMHESKKYNEAIQYAEIASRADATWAEPDFILGWYGLFLGKGDARQHLVRAVEKDYRVLFRIANDDLCKRYPDIINQLKAKYSDAAQTP